jgi:hypothetical protein
MTGVDGAGAAYWPTPTSWGFDSAQPPVKAGFGNFKQELIEDEILLRCYFRT